MAGNKKLIFTIRESAIISESTKQSEEKVEKGLKNTNWLMGAVVIVMVIGFLTMLAMTATLIIDSFHFNSTIYKEYSSKYEANNMLMEENKNMVETIKQNQEIITKNQKIIDDSINKNTK